MRALTRIASIALSGCLAAGTLGAPLAFAAPVVDESAASSSAYAAPTQAPNYEYKLEKVGSFSGEKNGLTFYKGAAIKEDGDKHYLIGPDGESLLGNQDISGAEYLGNNLFIVSAKTDDVNNAGVITGDGEVLLPCEAAVVKKSDYTDDPHFLKVVYATEETTDRDECFVYSTDRSFSFQPDAADTLYKGYAEIFSIDKKAKVKGVKLTTESGNSFYDYGESFVVQQEGYTDGLYDASGTEIWSSDNGGNANDECIVVYENGGYSIMDPTGQTRFSTTASLSHISDSDGLFRLQEVDGDYSIVDMDGNPMTGAKYEQVNSAAGGMFEVGSGSDESVVNADGDVVVKGSSGLTEIIPGYCTTRANNENVLIKSGKTLATGEDGTYSELVVESEDNQYLILNDGAKTIELAYANPKDTALVAGRTNSSSSSYGLYDLFTGNTLLDEEYETIDVAGDYVYAFADGTWTTYSMAIVNPSTSTTSSSAASPQADASATASSASAASAPAADASSSTTSTPASEASSSTTSAAATEVSDSAASAQASDSSATSESAASTPATEASGSAASAPTTEASPSAASAPASGISDEAESVTT